MRSTELTNTPALFHAPLPSAQFCFNFFFDHAGVKIFRPRWLKAAAAADRLSGESAAERV